MTEDKRAIDVIHVWEKEYNDSASFRSLWQETADLISPRHAQITTIKTPGRDEMREVYNTTAFQDRQDMVSGLSAAMIPSGQQFFGLVPRNRTLLEVDIVRRYLSRATQITHDELFESNFMLQLNETLDSLITFGTCNLYSEWEKKIGGLNFKAWDISSYQFLENNHGLVDTVLIKFKYTARQAIQEFGKDSVGEDIRSAEGDPKKENDIFDFIMCVRPNKTRNPRLSDNKNMAFECFYVDVKEKTVIGGIDPEGNYNEGGAPEMTHAVARWLKSASEKWGRGQGTECVPDVKLLQKGEKDLNEFGNKAVNPARDILESFEGTYRTKPGALNTGIEIPISKAIELGTQGAFPITEKILDRREERIHRAFFRDIFVLLGDLKGDRRTTVEIIERIKEGLRRLALPVARVYSELMTPVITRSVLILIRNGRIPYPPPELAGQGFGIEYIGELALALRNQQAKAFQQWAAFVGQMDIAFPGIDRPSDNIDSDAAVVRMGAAFGVNVEDIATEEERDAKRKARAQELQQQKIAAAAQIASEAYGKTSGAPEKGSPAEKVMAGMGV